MNCLLKRVALLNVYSSRGASRSFCIILDTSMTSFNKFSFIFANFQTLFPCNLHIIFNPDGILQKIISLSQKILSYFKQKLMRTLENYFNGINSFNVIKTTMNRGLYFWIPNKSAQTFIPDLFSYIHTFTYSHLLSYIYIHLSTFVSYNITLMYFSLWTINPHAHFSWGCTLGFRIT